MEGKDERWRLKEDEGGKWGTKLKKKVEVGGSEEGKMDGEGESLMEEVAEERWEEETEEKEKRVREMRGRGLRVGGWRGVEEGGGSRQGGGAVCWLGSKTPVHPHPPAPHS